MSDDQNEAVALGVCDIASRRYSSAGKIQGAKTFLRKPSCRCLNVVINTLCALKAAEHWIMPRGRDAVTSSYLPM